MKQKKIVELFQEAFFDVELKQKEYGFNLNF